LGWQTAEIADIVERKRAEPHLAMATWIGGAGVSSSPRPFSSPASRFIAKDGDLRCARRVFEFLVRV